ncbi:MAG: hypothetical protein JW969_05990 [Spirochaetales bacterium]|nr:hypothetical protein [Spirochaetales bacterium]
MNKLYKTTALLLLVLALGSCMSMFFVGLTMNPREKLEMSSKVNPEFENYGIKNIAVLAFSPSAKTESGTYTPLYATREHTPIPKYIHLENEGKTAANMFEAELLGTFKYKPVDRQKLDKVIEEMEFQLSGLVNEDSIKKIGMLSGADAVLTGSVRQALAALQYQSYGDTVYAAYIGYVDLEFRLTDVKTADVLWICNIQRNSLNYVDKPIMIASTADLDQLEKIGGPSENGVTVFVMKKAIEEAIATLP